MKPEHGNCQTKARGTFYVSLAIVIIFCNVFYVIEINSHTVAHFSLTEPHAPSLETKVIIGTDLSQFYNIREYPQ